MKPSKWRTAALAIFALGLSACAQTSLPTSTRDVSDVLADRAPSVIGASIVKDGSSREAQPLKVPARPLTADDAVALSLSHNRELWAALHELGAARGRAEQAGLMPNPEVDLGFRIPSNQDPLQMDIGLELKITEMLLVPQKRLVAEAELSAEKLRVAGEVLDVAFRARTAFFEAQAAYRRLELRTRALEAFVASFTVAKELHLAGNLPDLDLATRQAAVEQARITAAEQELLTQTARERMNVALGLAGEGTSWTTVEINETVDAPKEPLRAAYSKALSTNLELAALREKITAAGRRAGLAETAGNLPHIEGGLHAEQDGTAWEVGVHAAIGLPIFDRKQGTAAAARSEVLALRERYVASATNLQATLRAALSRAESAARRAQHYRNVLIPLRKKVKDEMVLQYNAMQVSVLRVLEAQRDITETEILYTDTLLEAHLARAAVDQILAGRHQGLLVAGSTSASSGGQSEQSGDPH